MQGREHALAVHEYGAQATIVVAGGQAAVPVVLDHVVMTNALPPPEVARDVHPGNAASLLGPGPLPRRPQLAPLLQGDTQCATLLL